MKKTYSLLIITLTIVLTGCASSGSKSVSANYCPKSYSPKTAQWLGDMANLAYEEKREKLRSDLHKQGFILDEYAIKSERFSVSGFIAYDKEKAVLAFSGTEDLTDWRNNAKTWSEKIKDSACSKPIRLHSGFYKAANKIINDYEKALFPHLAELQAQGKKIYITGHSLGGALATITAYYAENSKLKLDLAGVYTFGQPFTGDDDFQACYDKQLKDVTFRFVTDKDIIPKIRVDNSYRHMGIFLFFDAKGNIHTSKPTDYLGDFLDFVKSDLLDAHSMTDYTSALEKNKNVNPFACQ